MLTGAHGPLGAYGLHLPRLSADRLNSVPADASCWDIRWERWEEASLPAEAVTDDWATVHVAPRGFATIDRAKATSTLHLPEAPSSDALIHPYLGSTAVLAAHWAGRQTFHCGAFVHDGRAWGVLGHRNDGKSSTLAWLALQDRLVFTDDLLVVDGERALPGPRCLDLREGAAKRFGIGEDIGMVGNRQRFRVPLGPVPSELPFGGWVVLEWADEVEISVPPAVFRLRTLVERRSLLQQPTNPLSWLYLASRPMLVFRRPKDWTRLDMALGRLFDVLSSISDDRGAMLPG
jgi:hypothetical protein